MIPNFLCFKSNDLLIGPYGPSRNSRMLLLNLGPKASILFLSLELLYF